jgi:hypothetical protein
VKRLTTASGCCPTLFWPSGYMRDENRFAGAQMGGVAQEPPGGRQEREGGAGGGHRPAVEGFGLCLGDRTAADVHVGIAGGETVRFCAEYLLNGYNRSVCSLRSGSVT